MKKDIKVINPESNVAIATLWTRKEVIVERLGSYASKVNIVGTLYSMYGINFLLHTLAHTPEIDTLIVFGADLSKSGEALVKLFKERKVVEGFRLLWDLSELEELLDNVKLFDLRDSFRRGDWETLRQIIEKSYSPGRSVRKVIDLKLVEPVGVSSWSHQLSGHLLFENSLFRAWVKLLKTVMTYGYVKRTEYGERQKQFLNAVTIIGVFSKNYSLEKEFLSIFPRKDFEYHVRSLLSPEREQGVSYTYGERLLNHPLGKNQLEFFVDKLSEREDTRRALMVTWHHESDISSDNPPCLILVQGDLSGKFYNHTAYFRSHDVFSAWPLNAYGQIVMASRVAETLSRRLGREISVGYVTLISSSAHVYEHDWRSVEDVLEKYEDRVFRAFVSDPRGNFIIRVEGKYIVVEHRDWEGTLVSVYKDSDPYKLIKKMKLQSLLSMPDHAAYLAREIMRAYYSIISGTEYEQDRV